MQFSLPGIEQSMTCVGHDLMAGRHPAPVLCRKASPADAIMLFMGLEPGRSLFETQLPLRGSPARSELFVCLKGCRSLPTEETLAVSGSVVNGNTVWESQHGVGDKTQTAASVIFLLAVCQPLPCALTLDSPMCAVAW